ncbi:MAG: N-6 DNA methylase [Bacteroidales bacterium]|nr:N-6 DNA methylase [Bacteroidales bacterium]
MAKKIQLGYKEIEGRLRLFHEQQVPAAEVGYHLLYSFGKGERELERMREGKGVIKTFEGLLLKGEFCYCETTNLQLTARLEELKADAAVRKAAPKIIAVSDGRTLRAWDCRRQQTFEQQVDRLFCDFDFFYPLAGIERIEYVEESPADMKAAEKLAKLHDEIRAYNEFSSDSDLHDLNIFIARLLFCFFAEDTGIFEQNIFTDSVKMYTKEDGSDLNQFLDDAFLVMRLDAKDRPSELPAFILRFPFVSGGLFNRFIQLPKLSPRARTIIIECGELDWQSINPDIFGSMIQAVVNPDVRANQGMHYTSVPNIMKVIQPLFLDELTEEKNRLQTQLDEQKKLLTVGGITRKQFYEKGSYIKRGCRSLLKRMSQMKFFDPACGSGNFLIITYKQLRLLEMDILAIIRESQPDGLLDMEILQGSVISLNQFYGIELLDFPHEIAMLSLWLAEHQMNRKLYQDFGVDTKALPLKNITQIRCANACRIDWNEVCPHTKEEEVFVFGNPPYLGSSMQDEDQKEDMRVVCGHFENYKNLDYIACWFYRGAEFIENGKAKYAFVSTNSLCQGDSVALLWPNIFKKGLEIKFAYQSFKWTNNAKHNAAVIVVIIGIGAVSNEKKKLFDGANKCKLCEKINAYLLDGPDIIVGRLGGSISRFPEMAFGNKPSDGGFLILEKEERDSIIEQYPQSASLIKMYHGADSFINGGVRYCLWITDEDLPLAKSIAPIAERIENAHQGATRFGQKPCADVHSSG